MRQLTHKQLMRLWDINGKGRLVPPVREIICSIAGVGQKWANADNKMWDCFDQFPEHVINKILAYVNKCPGIYPGIHGQLFQPELLFISDIVIPISKRHIMPALPPIKKFIPQSKHDHRKPLNNAFILAFELAEMRCQ